VREKITGICNMLKDCELTKLAILDWAHHTVNTIYSSEIMALAHKDSGLHFSAANMTEERLRSFNISVLCKQMEDQAPMVWAMLDSLLAADPKLQYKRDWARNKAKQGEPNKRTKAAASDGDIEMSDITISATKTHAVVDEAELDDYYMHDFFDSEAREEDHEREDEPEDVVEQQEDRYKKHMIISTNKRCNALQSIMGIFLQSCNCPETLRELLARIGLSISTSTINDAVHNLSKEADRSLKELGRTLLALLAYDNIDFDLKHSVPTVEKAESTLIHLTSGTMMPLPDSITLADLDCADELWRKSPNNPLALPQDIPQIPFENLLTIHPEIPDSNDMLSRNRFDAWKFLHDLINYGPEYFRAYKRQLGNPEEIECIPVTKTTQIPCRTLDIHPSSPAQNADALAAFFQQAGVGDSTSVSPHPTRLVDNHVVLVFGDLLTGERIRSLRESRGAEKLPWDQMQHCIYVMGLFHLKMAAADAIWRVFIHPKKAKIDMGDNSLMSFVSQIRPKETGKIESNPGFRRLHEVIQHTGIVSRLDSWRVEIHKKTPEMNSLEDYARSKPSFEALQEMAITVSRAHVANRELTLDQDLKTDAERDMQQENVLLQQQYFLLYEELSHALNFGDIGRIEMCFLPWMFIFLGCGKHKYAAEKAVRMSILCNPTGKKGSFRAIDWVVEHNNLYTKVSVLSCLSSFSG
ncbi:hypothetical protein B0H34DRAFT_812416, partial [Crassisporium funariophilum]